MGPQPVINDLATSAGVEQSLPLSKLDDYIENAASGGRTVHFLPPYRAETKMTLGALLRENPCQMRTKASEKLIKAVVSIDAVCFPFIESSLSILSLALFIAASNSGPVIGILGFLISPDRYPLIVTGSMKYPSPAACIRELAPSLFAP